MARIFSIQFLYNNWLHHAMVEVRTTSFFTEYTISMLDEAIAELLPNNKILSTSNNRIAFADAAEENEPALMHAILQAMVARLHTVNV